MNVSTTPVQQPAPAAVDLRFDHPGRRRHLIGHLRGLHGDLDAVVVADPSDICYLTGVSHGISWLVVGREGAFAVSRQMLIREVLSAANGCEILLPTERSTQTPRFEEFLAAQLRARGMRTVAIDPARLPAQSYQNWLGQAVSSGIRLVEIPGCTSAARAVKDAAELALIRRCVGIAEAAFEGLVAAGARGLLGRTEREIAHELDVRMFELGADRQGFPETGIIVASGPNSASAHHTPGNRRLAHGDSLLIDWGAELVGYRSDMTRTVYLRAVPDFAALAYPVVEEALRRAAAQLKAGASMSEVDLIARHTVKDAGYEEFHYGVGHGVGLAVHEPPWLRADSTHTLETGMVTTLEPGIYLHGAGGIRIENLYRIGGGTSECLGHLPTGPGPRILE